MAEYTQKLSVRLTVDDVDNLDNVMALMQERLGRRVHVTKQMVITEAIEFLNKYYSRLEADKLRDR